MAVVSYMMVCLYHTSVVKDEMSNYRRTIIYECDRDICMYYDTHKNTTHEETKHCLRQETRLLPARDQ